MSTHEPINQKYDKTSPAKGDTFAKYTCLVLYILQNLICGAVLNVLTPIASTVKEVSFFVIITNPLGV